MSPLLGGYVADTFLGRSKTILSFSLIYSAGLLLVVVGAVPDLAIPGLIFVAIYTIALGTGGIKPNVSTLGADQFDSRLSRDREEKASFFNWYYYYGLYSYVYDANDFTLMLKVLLECEFGCPH